MKVKHIFLKPFSGKLFLKNRIFRINNGSNVFYKFKNKLKNQNIEINTIDIDLRKKADLFVFCDVPYPWELNAWKILVMNKNKSILFCFESPLVNPFSHIAFFHVFFNRIYTWNNKHVDRTKVFKFNLPQLDLDVTVDSVPFEKKKFLVLINSNKTIPWIFKLISPFKNDLYKERVSAIEYFENRIPNRFSLYGRGWNKVRKLSLKDRILGFKKYITYRGEAEDKIKLLSEFKFSLCFENCIAEGYITEKIFDCFKARCVPIYWGAPNIADYVDKRCFIDFRDFADYESMILYLNGINEKKYQQYIDAINEFLLNKKFQNQWSEKSFISVFLESINIH